MLLGTPTLTLTLSLRQEEGTRPSHWSSPGMLLLSPPSPRPRLRQGEGTYRSRRPVDLAGEAIGVGLAAADEAGLAVADEDDGGLEGLVVIAGHGETVGAGGGDGDDLALGEAG